MTATARSAWRSPRFLDYRTGQVGLAILAVLLVLAVLGPVVAPHPAGALIGPPAAKPATGAPLGTDFLGRDVLSRVLSGGRSILWLSAIAALLTYMIGGAVGLIAGYRRTLMDPILMRTVDVLLAFPPILIMLLLVTGAGNSKAILIVGVVLVLAPGVARIVRTATLEQSVRGYVEAAIARGERAPRILGREILPNIIGPLVADFGIRFGAAIIVIASVNYLGLGLQPPAADWGLMTSENRSVISANPLSVLVPGFCLAALTISVNLIGDATTRGFDRSRVG